LTAEIESRDLALHALDCTLIYEHAPPTVFRVELSRASRAWKHVATLARQRLTSLALVEGVIGLRVVAARTERWHGRQADLFASREPGSDEAVGCLIDRLVNRLGTDAVARPVMIDDHQPEAAFRYLAAAEQGLKALEDVAADPPATSAARPLRVLSKPEPIRVIALVPDGPPTWCATREGEYAIACAWGPERIETAWWRGPDIRRDYFRVMTECGDQFWVYHVPDTPNWFLHGVFA
jgi:protein ImuB